MKLQSLLLARIEEEEEEEELDLDQLLVSQIPGFWPGAPAFYGSDTRAVLISGEITEEVANSVIAQMQQLQTDNPEAPIRVYVNTIGGCAASAFALYDWMRCLSNPIIGIAYGRCSSAGLPILMGADLRIATPRCRFFYHEVVSGMGVSSIAESEEAIKNYQWYQETMKSILMERAKKVNKSTWKKHFHGKTSFFFDTTFALEMGIVHDQLEEITKKVTLAED